MGLIQTIKNALVPMVLKKEPGGERSFDIFSLMLNERIIFMHEDVNDSMASVMCASLLYLEQQDPKKDIYMYINSPGGVVTAGLAIYDTMQYIKPDIVTVTMGQACSMGSFLLSAGAKGKRYSLPSSRIMIHQPSGGAQGQATNIEIQAKEILRLKTFLTQKLADHCGKTYQEVYDACERDNFMSAQEALEFGLIDKVISRDELDSSGPSYGGKVNH